MCILYTFLVLISKHKQIVIWLKEHNMEEIPGLKGVRPRALKFPDWHGSGNRTKKTEKGKQNTKTWKSEKRKLTRENRKLIGVWKSTLVHPFLQSVLVLQLFSRVLVLQPSLPFFVLGMVTTEQQG